MKRHLMKIITSIHEPRLITALMVLGYAVAVATGVGVLCKPSILTGLGHSAMRTIIAATLIPAGIIGGPVAWTGRWYIERGVALLASFGWLTATAGAVLAEIVQRQDQTLAMPVVTIGGGITASILYLTRYARCRTAPHAPGTGPELPEERSRQMIAAINR